MLRIRTISLVVSLGALLPQIASAQSGGVELDDLIEDVGYHRFAWLMRESGIADELRSRLGEVTVLVPEVTPLDLFMDDPKTPLDHELGLVHGLLAQHVVEGRFDPGTIAIDSRRTLLPFVKLSPGKGSLVNVNGATTVPTGRFWIGRNGNIIEVTQVISPALSLDHYLAEGGFELFREALVATGITRLELWDTKATVLVPTDDAFLAQGLDQNAIHDPGNRARMTALVAAHLLESAGPDALFERSLVAMDGAKVWAEPVWDEAEARERDLVVHDGAPRAAIHDDYAPIETHLGVIWVIDAVMDPKSP